MGMIEQLVYAEFLSEIRNTLRLRTMIEAYRAGLLNREDIFELVQKEFKEAKTE